MNLEQKIGLIEMMTHVERITLIAKLKFKTSMLKSSLCDYKLYQSNDYKHQQH